MYFGTLRTALRTDFRLLSCGMKLCRFWPHGIQNLLQTSLVEYLPCIVEILVYVGQNHRLIQGCRARCLDALQTPFETSCEFVTKVGLWLVRPFKRIEMYTDIPEV